MYSQTELAVLIPLLIVLSYLSGSVMYAVIVTRVVAGKDIREIGNKNPGTSNVVRNVGKGWGVLVGFLDAFKVLGLLIVARIFLLPENSELHFGLLYLMGIFGVVGHCKPLFSRFRGGGGIGTMQGVSLFFVPVEYLVSMLIGGLVVLNFFKNVQYKFGQWIPIMFVSLTPFITLLAALTVDIPLFGHFSIGGHPWSVVAGTFAMSFIILGMNISFMQNRARELKELEAKERE